MGPLPLTVSSDDARHRPPPTGVDWLERLAPVDNREWGHQVSQLAGAQQVLLRGRAPARVALCFEERFHDEQAAGRHQPNEPRHAGSVKIIEYQNRIKTVQIRPLTLEIQLAPFDGESCCECPIPGGREPGSVAVHGYDLRAQLRRGDTVASLPAPDIQYPGPGG
jgi:hypothetical protein